MSWTPKPLRELLEQSGRHRAGDQDLPVLSITMKHGLVDQADKFKKRVASSDTSNYRVAYKNELVVGFPIDEGVLGFQTKYPAGIVSPAYDIWKLRNEADSHIPYLERYLRSAQARSSYASRMQGAVARRRSLTKTDFLNLEIPFPPLDSQIRIAHLLGKVEGLIAQRKQHLRQLDDLLKSVFLEMFGDPVRNEKGWTAAPLEQLGSINRGVSKHRPRNDPKLLGGPHPLIQTGEVSNAGTYITTYTQTYSDLGFAQSKRWPAGTLCITIAANIAQTGILTFDACFPDSVVGFLAHEGESNTLYVLGLFWFFQAILEKNAPAAAQKNINLEILRALSVPKPPIELQSEFATIVEKVEALKSRYQQSLTDLEALYGALSQQAFKGELNLSRVALPAAPIEGESPVAAAVPAPITTPVIELPDTELLLPALQDRTQLAPALRFWLEAYCTQLGSAAFSLERFIAAAQTRLSELHPNNDFELRASDYEIIKAWVFEALAAGALTQAFDDDGNRIELKSAAVQSLA
ncbi:restriction endonuclease subunit S [Ralstonia pickettii]|uniref:Restriction endonuclease subunit S n=1 Tax=Ralstonia pickettii TaxID=329 RepID=A0A7X2HRJ8_RALPI|nr:restriction endonuclease subunit S [Ralstonia pickettii]MRT01413.1 restriction endonuclease subunit S [Ralstonia pickettii]